MWARAFIVLLLAGTCLTCQPGDAGTGGACPSGRACGFSDHKYFSTYHCGGMGVGYSWRELDRCIQQCGAAANWGCDAGGCDSGCAADHGTGSWLPCTEANGGTENSGGCFLSGSGMNGETVPCECR